MTAGARPPGGTRMIARGWLGLCTVCDGVVLGRSEVFPELGEFLTQLRDFGFELLETVGDGWIGRF